MSYTEIDGSGVLYDVSDVNSGTGNYSSFLRLQQTEEEEGFNTDDQGIADNKNGIWTHSIQIGSLIAVEYPEGSGNFYYQIRLDLNEGNAEGDPPINLTDLRLFYSDDPATEADYDNNFVNLEEVFNLGDALALTDIHTGSGSDDYAFLIPVELFKDANPADYFTLYSQFTGSDGGFEEWRALAQDVGDGLPKIHLEKDAEPLSISEGTPTDVLYTYKITNLSPGDDALDLTSFIDDNGTPGDTGDDVDLLVEGTFVGGDDDNDGLLDVGEEWTFTYLRTGVELNAGTLTNIATVTGVDEEGFSTSDDDDAVVTIDDVLPDIHIEKDASVTQVQAGLPTEVTFTYTITNTSTNTMDALDLTSLIDDMASAPDVDLLTDGIFVSGDADNDGLLDKTETWIFTYTTDVTLGAGETRTNTVSVTGVDEEGNSATDDDTATITAYNLGRTPGFWSNEKNGGKLWDGKDGTMPNGGMLGTTSFVGPNKDLLYTVNDLNGDGSIVGAAEIAGNRCYLLIGDWNHDGIANNGENVLAVTRTQAMTMLNASEKQQQDGRWMVARDLVASWLNFLGGSYVGASTDTDSARHYMDEAIAWLRATSVNSDHILNPTVDFASGKIGTSTVRWTTGFDFDDPANGVQNDVPLSGDILGQSVGLDILGGGQIHTGLDHYNNFGYV